MLVGLTGPSASGKTYSALRLSTGMVSASGGEIYVIDTESRRSLQYAEEFNFRHVEMDAPFSPLDYLQAIEYCKAKGARVIVVDSMSHEHEGPGGVLEMHDAELDRMCGNDFKKRDRMTFAAWAKPKAQRRRLINEIIRMGVNGIFCFRAKPKLKMVKGQDPIDLGWQAIAGDEFLFEMTVNFLLYPGSGGVPTVKPEQPGERAAMKMPKNLEHVFKPGSPLDEAAGAALAKWAEGAQSESKALEAVPIEDALAEFGMSSTDEELMSRARAFARYEWSDAERATLREAVRDRKKALEAHRVAETHDDRDGFTPAEEPDVEVDPETGEVIPDGFGMDQEAIDTEFVEGK
jgi:energy-coupling factor transporter ATP-binding protein EcfA2